MRLRYLLEFVSMGILCDRPTVERVAGHVQRSPLLLPRVIAIAA